MSLKSYSKTTKILKPLTGDEDSAAWKNSVNLLLFESETQVTCLSLGNSKKFKKEWEGLEGEDEGDPENPLEDDDFLSTCYEHACYTGLGFDKWVYRVYPKIIGSLSDEIKEQVAGVQHGDLVDLMIQVDIAIKHFEIFDPTDLELEYSKMTMEDTNNNVILFITRLKMMRQRLKKAKEEPSERKAMKVLLNGLNKFRQEDGVSGGT